jgi:mannose-6-phosphate isomerase-like protein (cupin superfamily)
MRHLRLVFIFITLAVLSISATYIINSSVYDWQKLKVKKTSIGEERTILSGPTRSLKMLDVRAVSLNSGQEYPSFTVMKGNDELIIIKEGSAIITINGENKDLAEGSIAVVSQGDKIAIRPAGSKAATFYRFVFTPEATTIRTFSPVIKEWSSIEFKTNANGGRRDIIKQPTSFLKELEMHTTQLNEGLPSHAPHNHADEEVILVRFGTVEETINGTPYKLGPGSLIFLSNKDEHGISNAGTGKCEYYAIRWLVNSENEK